MSKSERTPLAKSADSLFVQKSPVSPGCGDSKLTSGMGCGNACQLGNSIRSEPRTSPSSSSRSFSENDDAGCIRSFIPRPNRFWFVLPGSFQFARAKPDERYGLKEPHLARADRDPTFRAGR